jgi:outer membrane lipoprotein-sorting protein
MVGRFLQIGTNGGRTEGTFFLERPNKVAFRYAPPSREEIVSIGKGFYVLNRKDETYYAYPQDTIPLRQFLGDQIDLLAANVINVTTTDGYISITVIDETVAGTVQVSLIFDTATKELAQWSLVEPSGAELTFSLYDVEKDVRIPPAFFSIPATYKAVQQ